ncbi:MAG: DEAD/DEAH box helicase family protein [Candidatus Latescibacterota bacterium]|jgi:superfamily II DNA or RNA helicase
MTDRDHLRTELARAQARLAAAQTEARQAAAEVADLQRQWAALLPARAPRTLVDQSEDLLAGLPAQASAVSSTSPPTASPPTTNAEKVTLFRHLFHGRPDVFPRRWENARTGRSGYAPACAHEWQAGLCQKLRAAGSDRRSTCSQCEHQAFLPVSDEVIAAHLRGDQVIGVYPLLTDDTCWFLAADFDQASWQEDVAAFSETCQEEGIPVAVERSRSGAGAHAWLFFSTPVPAAAARQLGSCLVTLTMAAHHQLAMSSYDRLFPSQDILPRGGFGGLIALPLQRQARERGNTLFLDEDLVPWPDQWTFLASVARLDPARVHILASQATRSGQVLGSCLGTDSEESDLAPWQRPPSGRSSRPVGQLTGPATVQAVLAQRLFIAKAGLTSPLLNELKRLAAFANPEFYERERQRRPTHGVPRMICCAEELPEYLVLPRGCLPATQALLTECGTTLVLEDQRDPGEPLGVRFTGELTPLQQEAAQALLAHDLGVLVAPPGAGKTVIGTYLIAARNTSTLVLVHRRPLLDQWLAQLSLFLGIDRHQLGQLGAGQRRHTGRLDVALYQSLVRRGQVSDLVVGYGQVIGDESHHGSSVSFERVLAATKARYVVGLTATPTRRDGHHPISHLQLGPVRYRLEARRQATTPLLARQLVVRRTTFTAVQLGPAPSIQELYAALAAAPQRNDLIFDDVVRALAEGRSPLVLTERRDHLEYLADRLQSFTRHLVVLHGGLKAKERRAAFAQLADLPDREERLVLATGRYLGEGFDDARLDTLFLALPVSWRGTLVQYTGRLHRQHPGKTQVRLYDYADLQVPMLARMFARRQRGYRALGYLEVEAPANSPPPPQLRLTYDDSAVSRACTDEES